MYKHISFETADEVTEWLDSNSEQFRVLAITDSNRDFTIFYYD